MTGLREGMRDGLELRSSMKHLATDTFWRAVTRALLGSLVLAVLTAICYRMQVASISRPVYSVALTSGEPLVAEARALRADGEYRWLVIRAVPLRDERGNIIKWYGTDIEDEKRAGEALQRAQVELAHVTRVTTLGELAASIAHEINQPLAAIVTDANACLHWLNAHGPLLQSCAKR